LPSLATGFEVDVKVLHAPNTHWYQQALVKSLRDIQIEVDDFAIGWGEYLPELETHVLGFAPDILHLHWPESMFRQKATGMTFRIMRKLYLKLAGSDEEWARWLYEIARTLMKLKRSGIRLVWTMHNLLPHDADERNRAAYRQLYQCFAGCADAVVHHSECGMRSVMENHVFTPSCRHKVIRFGYFEDELPEEETREEARRALGIRPDATVFLAVGKLDPRKNLEFLSRALREAADPKLTLVIAGSGSADYLRRIRAVFGGAGDVRLAGACTQEELSRYARASDSLVFPPAREEPLTSGAPHLSQGFLLPQVTTASPYTVEVLGNNALYYDGTVEDLVARMRDVLGRAGAADDHFIARVKENLAKERREYSWPQVAASTRDLYVELTGSR